MRQKGYELTWFVAEKKIKNMKQTQRSLRSIRDNNSKTGRDTDVILNTLSF